MPQSLISFVLHGRGSFLPLEITLPTQIYTEFGDGRGDNLQVVLKLSIPVIFYTAKCLDWQVINI